MGPREEGHAVCLAEATDAGREGVKAVSGTWSPKVATLSWTAGRRSRSHCPAPGGAGGSEQGAIVAAIDIWPCVPGSFV